MQRTAYWQITKRIVLGAWEETDNVSIAFYVGLRVGPLILYNLPSCNKGIAIDKCFCICESEWEHIKYRISPSPLLRREALAIKNKTGCREMALWPAYMTKHYNS